VGRGEGNTVFIYYEDHLFMSDFWGSFVSSKSRHFSLYLLLVLLILTCHMSHVTRHTWSVASMNLA
jgi:hypothetical protein